MQEPPQRLRGAIVRGNLAITKRLLARFPELWLNIDPNNNGWCNLHYASYHGNYLVCFHLVSLMNRKRESSTICDLDLITFDNLTVLHMPLMKHHSQTLHFLLQEFSGNQWINHRGGPLARTPLHYCCVHGFADGLKLLLEFGADWTVQDKNGDTCLHLCFEYGHLEGLEELVKFTATRRLKRYLQESTPEYEDESKEIGPKDSKLPSGSAVNHTKSAIRAAVQEDIARFESITNNKGWRAEDYAATFDMAQKYDSLKETWIDLAVEEELALRHLTGTDSSLSMYVYDPIHDRLAKLSLQSLDSSFHAQASTGSAYSSLAGEAGVLSSPIHLVMQPLLASSRRGSVVENLAEATNALPSLKDAAAETKARQHSRSLPASTPEPPGERPLQTRKRSSTSVAFALRPPPLLAIRTPVLASGSMPQPPSTPLLMELFKADLSKTPSLKSVTISPLVRYLKRRSSDDVTDDTRADPKPSSFHVVTSTTSSTSTASPGSITPTSRRSSFSLSPLKFALRQRSASISNPPKFEASNAARAAAEAAVRSRGSLFRLQQPPSADKASKIAPRLHRNVSTPAFSSSSMDIASRKAPKQAAGELSKQLLQIKPVVETLSTDGSLDTIDLSSMLIDEATVRHRFTLPIAELDTDEINSPEKLREGSIIPNSDPPNKPHFFSRMPSHSSDVSTPRRPSLSQRSTALGSSDNISPTARRLARNVSSISFTRVRDE